MFVKPARLTVLKVFDKSGKVAVVGEFAFILQMYFVKLSKLDNT